MSFKTNVFFGTLILLALSISTAIAQQDSPNIAWFESFFKNHQPGASDSLFIKAQQRYEDALQSHDLTLQAEASKELGLLNLTIGHDIDKAMTNFIDALVLEDSLKLRGQQVITYLCIAEVFQRTGNYSKAQEMLEQAFELNRGFNDAQTFIVIYIKLGKAHLQLGNFEDATQDFKAALNYTTDIEGTPYEADAYFQLGKIEAKKGKYVDALDLLKKSLAISRTLRDREHEALALNEVGGLYTLMGNEEKALANYVVALEIWQKENSKEGLATVYNNVGALYSKQGNIERAKLNLELALAAAKEAQSQEQMKRSYELLSNVYKELKDFQQALLFKEQYVTISDFIQQERDEQVLLATQSGYEFKKKEEQIQKLENIRKARENELKEERQTRNLLMTIVGCVLVVLLLLAYMYMVKQKTNKVLQVANNTVRQQNVSLQELNATKDKFFSIISHDLKGPLNSLTSFSGLLINHTDSLSKDEIKMLAKDLDKSLKNLFALLENLLEWSRSQTGNIEFKPERFDLSALLKQNHDLLLQQAQNKKITIEVQAEPAIQVNAHKNSINTVVRNLLSNAIKFTPAQGTITLKAFTKDDKVVVGVIDNGVGMSKEVMDKLFRIDSKHTTKGTADEKGTGLGLILCKEFIEKNGGRIWVESVLEKGSSFYFELPLTDVLQPTTAS